MVLAKTSGSTCTREWLNTYVATLLSSPPLFTHTTSSQNIGVMAEYYQRVKSARLAQLLDLSEAETEKYISEMVSSGSVWAKIDRPKGIVTFRKRQEPNDQLNDWSHNINELLGLLEKVREDTKVASMSNLLTLSLLPPRHAT